MRRAPFAWSGLALFAFAAPLAAAQAPGLGALGAEGGGKPIGIESTNGIEWRQTDHVYIARGNVKATRGDDTVFADTLYAYYRPVNPPPGGEAAPKRDESDPTAGGSTQIYRMEADGNVRMTTPLDTIYGDHAAYDVDQAVVVVTGAHLRLVTPRDTVTARDSLEWYDQQQVGVARGDAVAVRGDRKVRGDVLTAHVDKAPNGSAQISRIDAAGNVVIAAPGQLARGDAGVYNLDTGVATLTGRVQLTRGQSELRGRYAVVNLNTHVSRLLAAPPDAKLTGGAPPRRVVGLVVPRPKPQAPTQ